MRRSTCSRLTGFALVAILVLAGSAATRAATPEDRTSIERGRTAGRGMMMLRDARVIGIALLHARSQSDVDAFLAGRGDGDFASVPGVGPHPATGLRAFVNDGERTGFDNALRRFNDAHATPAMWNRDSRAAALFDAGAADVVVTAAGGNAAQEQLSVSPVIDLADHVARIPEGALGVDLTPILRGVPSAPDGMHPSATAFARDLAAALDASAPSAPIAALQFADGAAGDAALGVAGSTVAEFIDSPLWMMQADSQHFIDGYAARLIALAPASRARVEELRVRLRGGPDFAHGPAAHDAALQANTALMGAIVQSNKPRKMPILLGSLAAQLVYNAAILRDPNVSAVSLRMLGTEAALDAGVPGWAEARTRATAIGASDWTAQYHFGLRLVDLIMKGGSH